MKTKLFAALKQKYSTKTGLSDEVLQAYADSLAATGLVTDENLSAVVDAQEPALKKIQSGLDQERTAKTNLQKQLDDYKTANPVKGGNPEKDEPTNQPLTLEGIKSVVSEMLTPVLEKVTGFETQTKQEKRLAEISAKAKEYGVPDAFVSRLGVPEEADLDEYFKGVKQEFINIGYSGSAAPEGGTPPKGDTSAIADLINSGTKQIVESQKQ